MQFAGRMMAKGQFRADIEKALFLKVNAYRAGKGLKVLEPDATLQFAARAHAGDMSVHGFIGHVASTGQDFDSRMRAFKGGGLLILPAMGENAAAFKAPDGADPDSVAEGLFQSWLHSNPHRLAMASRDYLRGAVGVSVAGGKAYADQIFVGAQVQTNIFGASP
ncbi:CAP domain-containing protein [Aestuariivirga litoralis]|uniref:CAP domain-containing protein n=1 Tax=Aestuariivirga litoralis TaxID=2650924 RepID=UPI0018C7411D|nr:CAP domain-containing protein [Aestuariivirga litoralis]